MEEGPAACLGLGERSVGSEQIINFQIEGEMSDRSSIINHDEAYFFPGLFNKLTSGLR